MFKNKFFILDQNEWNFLVMKMIKKNKNKKKKTIERIVSSKTFEVIPKSRGRILIPKKFRKN